MTDEEQPDISVGYEVAPKKKRPSTVIKHIDFEPYRKLDGWKETETSVTLSGQRFDKGNFTIIMASRAILKQLNPMTVRQCYYALFSRGYIVNSDPSYRKVVSALVIGRQCGLIDWEWIEDRTRRPRVIGMWDNLKDFLTAVKRSYTRNVWLNQSETYFEFWVEKDALSGIFSDMVDQYGVTLNVGRGYDGWSSIRAAAQRFKPYVDEGKEVKIFYYGDFDPSGEDMVRSLRDRLSELGCEPEIIKRAITQEDIEEHDLPPAPGKPTDSRSAGFEEKYGELIQIELDALPVDVLRERIEEDITNQLDMDAYEERTQLEKKERTRLTKLIDSLDDDEDGDESDNNDDDSGIGSGNTEPTEESDAHLDEDSEEN